MKRRIAALSLVLLVGMAAAAQDAPIAIDEFPNALGGSVFFPIIGGVSWQRWYGDVGISVTAGGIYMPESTGLDYGILFSLDFRLYATDFADWFASALYLTTKLGHRGIMNDYQPYVPFFYLSAGVGMETVFFRHLSTVIEFQYYGRFPPTIEFALGFALRYRY